MINNTVLNLVRKTLTQTQEKTTVSEEVTTVPHFCHFSTSSLQIPHSMFNWKRFIKLARCSIVCCPNFTLLLMSLFTFTLPVQSLKPGGTWRRTGEVGWGRDPRPTCRVGRSTDKWVASMQKWESLLAL